MHHRTELVHVLRSIVYQQGQTFPNGFEIVALIEAALQDPNTQISDVVRLECLDLITRIARLAEKTALDHFPGPRKTSCARTATIEEP